MPVSRPYQGAATDALIEAAKPSGAVLTGQNRLLIKKPTGTGKTVWFASLLRDARIKGWLEQFPKHERKMLVIAHREELLEQAREKIEAQNPGLMVSIEQADRHANRFSDVVVASIQTLSSTKFKRLKALLKFWGSPRIVIVDEAHHAAASTYRTALVHLGFLPPADASEAAEIEAANDVDVELMTKALEGWDVQAPRDRLLIGVTATPNRSDAIGLGCVFQSIAFSYGLKQAIDDGWLVPIVPWVVETSANLDAVRINRGEFNQKDLAAAVNTEDRNRVAVEAWHKYGAGLPTLVFTVDVAHAHALAEEFRNAGLRFEALSGETPKEERREMLRKFRAGELDGICNCMVLTEGTDLPMVRVILHAKPTKSATLYEQMTGRGLRPLPGDPVGPERVGYTGPMVKPDCIVIDIVDIARRHSLQTAPVLYGLPPGINAEGKNLKDVADAFDEFRMKYPGFDIDGAAAAGRMTLGDLEVRASLIDIWTIQDLGTFGNGRSLSWVKLGDSDYRLQYPWQDGTETISIQKDMLGKFEIVATLRPSNGGPARQRTLAASIETEDGAATMAESWVMQERRSVMKLADRNAAWREGDASPRQLALLRRLRIPYKAGISKGEASTLIDMGMARRR